MLERESVPTLDLLPALERHPDPLSLYPQRQMGHFNEAGYRFIAERLLDELARR
jgi:lysophospholipase L1-like esterase